MVDLSTLKVGDTIVLRNGNRHVVSEIACDDTGVYSVTTLMERYGRTGLFHSESWSHYHDGCLYFTSDLPHPGDILRIIPVGTGAEPVSTGGVKHDNGKPDYSLLTRPMLESMIGALMHGERKYQRGNFKQGFTNTRLVAAAMRHLMAYLDGEDLDPESGVSHLGHAQAAIGMLLDNQATGTSTDGRYGK